MDTKDHEDNDDSKDLLKQQPSKKLSPNDELYKKLCVALEAKNDKRKSLRKPFGFVSFFNGATVTIARAPWHMMTAASLRTVESLSIVKAGISLQAFENFIKEATDEQ